MDEETRKQLLTAADFMVEVAGILEKVEERLDAHKELMDFMDKRILELEASTPSLISDTIAGIRGGRL